MKTKQAKKTSGNITVSMLLTYLISLLKQENETVKKEYDEKKKEYEIIGIPFSEKIKYLTAIKLNDFISLAADKFSTSPENISELITVNWNQLGKYLDKSYEQIFTEVSLTGDFCKDLRQYLMLLGKYGKKVVSCRQTYKLLNINSYLDIEDSELSKYGIKTIWIYKNPYYTLAG